MLPVINRPPNVEAKTSQPADGQQAGEHISCVINHVLIFRTVVDGQTLQLSKWLELSKNLHKDSLSEQKAAVVKDTGSSVYHPIVGTPCSSTYWTTQFL